ncbi:MAG: hypothetical protein ACFCD0_03800 [Gemmataceae bacterium]
MSEQPTIQESTSEEIQNGSSPELTDLHQRLQRLEDAIASLQDTKVLEDRVYERVSERIQSTLEAAGNVSDKVTEKKPSGWSFLGSQKQSAHQGVSDGGGPSESRVRLASSLTGVGEDRLRDMWFVGEVWQELGTILRMFTDVRYHIGWFARMATMVLVPLMLLADYWMLFQTIPIVGPLVRNAAIMILAYFLYKILSREARRYSREKARQTTEDN